METSGVSCEVGEQLGVAGEMVASRVEGFLGDGGGAEGGGVFGLDDVDGACDVLEGGFAGGGGDLAEGDGFRGRFGGRCIGCFARGSGRGRGSARESIWICAWSILAAVRRRAASPMTRGLQRAWISGWARALTMISGPMPEGSPMVMAMVGRFWARGSWVASYLAELAEAMEDLEEGLVIAEGAGLGDDRDRYVAVGDAQRNAGGDFLEQADGVDAEGGEECGGGLATGGGEAADVRGEGCEKCGECGGEGRMERGLWRVVGGDFDEDVLGGGEFFDERFGEAGAGGRGGSVEQEWDIERRKKDGKTGAEGCGGRRGIRGRRSRRRSACCVCPGFAAEAGAGAGAGFWRGRGRGRRFR